MRLIRNTTITALAAAVALFAFSPQVRAQARRGGFGSEGVKVRLLNEAKVQEELKLTDEQKSEARKAGEGLQGLFAGGAGQQLSQEERQKRFQEIQEKTKSAAEQATKSLSKEQKDRLDQIALQVRGAGALSDEKVAADLKLTDDQKQKLREIQQQVMQQMRDLQRGDQEKRAQITKTAGEQSLAVLTTEQREHFQKMQGAKIDLPQNFGFGGRRRAQ